MGLCRWLLVILSANFCGKGVYSWPLLTLFEYIHNLSPVETQDHLRFPSQINQEIAVGMPITRHPPHRSQRALLMHWAPASSIDAHALQWIRHSMPYPIQLIWQKYPALCLVSVSLGRIPLSQPSFLHLLRHSFVVTCLVRRLLRYYWAVRLPVPVHHCVTPLGFSMRTLLQSQ